MKAGYARGVYSSAEVQRILGAFSDASCGEVVINVRPQSNHIFKRLVEKLAPGDTLAVWTFTCAAAKPGDLVQLIADLGGRSIGFESISEGFVVPPGSILSPAMIAERIDRIRSNADRPARRPTRQRAIRPASVERGGIPSLAAAAPAR